MRLLKCGYDCFAESRRRKRLLQKNKVHGGGWYFLPVQTRHQDNSNRRKDAPDGCGNCEAIDIRHLEVGDENVDVALAPAGKQQCFGSITRAEHGVALVRKNGRYEGSERGVIFGDEYCGCQFEFTLVDC